MAEDIYMRVAELAKTDRATAKKVIIAYHVAGLPPVPEADKKFIENDAAVQIAKEAFRAGWLARDAHLDGYATPELTEHWIQKNWDAYEPSEAVKDLTR